MHELDKRIAAVEEVTQQFKRYMSLSQEPYILSQGPYIFFKEPYILSKEPWIL